MLLTVAVIAFVIPSSYELLGLGWSQSTSVTGRLTCNGQPASGIRVKMYDNDLVLDAKLAEVTTDSNGVFTITGGDSEISTIDAKINIYHKCNYNGLCYKKLTINIPSNYITSGSTPTQTFNIGTLNLANQFSGETIDSESQDFIIKLLSVGLPDRGLTKVLTEVDIIDMTLRGRELFLSQPPMVEMDPPIRICGDTHGQYADLLRLFHKGGFPPTQNYLFLGDYVDRGKQNLEVIILLTSYKLRYPKSFFLLRGNHECPNVNRTYGFFDECMRRYQSQRLWQAFQDMFSVMPLCGLVAERILCMHGGLSPHMNSLDQLRNIPRPTDAVGPTLEMDILWADPVVGQSGFQTNMRGASVSFGADVLHKICKELNIDLVARAHQVVQDGYEFFGGRKCVTIFSAPHYCGQFDNAAAMMIVDENMQCTFEVFRPTQGRKDSKPVATTQGTAISSESS